jgi:hypothetical protein
MTGLSRQQFDGVYQLIERGLVDSSMATVQAEYSNPLSPRNRLVMALHWLRHNVPLRVLSALFPISHVHARRTLRKVLTAIDDSMYARCVRWPHPLNRGSGVRHPSLDHVRVVIDSTVIAVERPADHTTRQQYSYYKAPHWGLKALFAVGFDGLFYASTPPVPASTHDTTLLADSDIADMLDDQHHALGDKGFQGAPNVVVPFRGQYRQLSRSQRAHNSAVYRARALVENALKRLKDWKAVSGPLRADREDQLFSGITVRTATALTNLQLQAQPLRRH